MGIGLSPEGDAHFCRIVRAFLPDSLVNVPNPRCNTSEARLRGLGLGGPW